MTLGILRDIEGVFTVANRYGEYLLDSIRKWEDYQRQQSELGKKKQFDLGRILPGLISSSSSGNIAPAIISALGEGLRASKGSDDDLASVALKAFQEYAPTKSPRMDTFEPRSVDMSLPESPKAMLGGREMPSILPEDTLFGKKMSLEGVGRKSSPMGNLGAMMQDFMVRPETLEEREFGELSPKIKQGLKVSSVGPGKRATYETAKSDELGMTLKEATQVAKYLNSNNMGTGNVEYAVTGSNGKYKVTPRSKSNPFSFALSGQKLKQMELLSMDPITQQAYDQVISSASDMKNADKFMRRPFIPKGKGKSLKVKIGSVERDAMVQEYYQKKGVNMKVLRTNLNKTYSLYKGAGTIQPYEELGVPIVPAEELEVE